MRSRVFFGLVTVVLALGALWCTRFQNRRSELPAHPSALLGAATGLTPTAVDLSAPAPRARVGGYEPDTIVCGSKLCKSGSEACCKSGDESVCAQLQRVPVHQQWISDDWVDCDTVGLTGSSDEIDLCDDSGDCPGGKVCCSNWLVSGVSASVCIAAKPGGENVCDYFERCVEGHPCRTAETQCEAGRCELRGAAIRCGSSFCEATSQVCCERDGKLGCTTDAACGAPGSGARAHHCTGPSGCPHGSRCTARVYDSRCQGLIDIANTSLLCETDGDCPEEVCSMIPDQHGKPRCRRLAGRRLKFCECS